jgi:hypothetical protein
MASKIITSRPALCQSPRERTPKTREDWFAGRVAARFKFVEGTVLKLEVSNSKAARWKTDKSRRLNFHA